MKPILTFTLLFFVSVAFCQLPDYYVDLVTGSVTLSRPGGKSEAVKYKQLIYKTDKITVAKGAELTLVDRDAGFYVINTSGTNSAGEWVKKATRKTKDGVTTGYLKLLFHELLDPNQDFDKFKKENVAGVWGGVSRGDECGNRILPIPGYKTSGPVILFKWHKTSATSKYTLDIYDEENKPAGQLSVTDTFISIKTAVTLNGKVGVFKWRVLSEYGRCEDEMPIYFEVLSPESEKKLIQQALDGTTDSNLENKLQQVDKLEKNGLIEAASTLYAGIVKAIPGNRALQKSYVAFLLKYGFDQEARAAWKK